MRRLLALGLVVILLSGCTQVATGPAPAFKLIDSQGQEVTLEKYQGKKVLLFFIAADGSCPSCEVETKNELVPVHQKHAANVQFLSIDLAMYSSHEKLENFKQRTGATWPHALDRDGVQEKFQVSALSTAILLDEKHEIIYSDVGPSASEIEARLAA